MQINQRSETIDVTVPHLRGLFERESRAVAIESLQLSALEQRSLEIEPATKHPTNAEKRIRGENCGGTSPVARIHAKWFRRRKSLAET